VMTLFVSEMKYYLHEWTKKTKQKKTLTICEGNKQKSQKCDTIQCFRSPLKKKEEKIPPALNMRQLRCHFLLFNSLFLSICERFQYKFLSGELTGL